MNETSPEQMANSTILVCATQRSGSTMLCEDMTNAGVFGKPREYFLGWLNMPKDQFNWQEEYVKVKDMAMDDNRQISFKLMSNYFGRILDRLNTIEEVSGLSPDEKLQRHFGKITWVRLIRKDKISQAVSREIASQSKVYHVASGNESRMKINANPSKDEPFIPTYSFKKLLFHLTNIEREELLWDHFFSQLKIKPLTFVYEAIVKDPTYLKALEKETGKEVQADYISHRSLKKLGNTYNDHMKERFRADLDKWSSVILVNRLKRIKHKIDISFLEKGIKI